MGKMAGNWPVSSSNFQLCEAIKTRLTKTFGLTHRVRASRLLQMGDLGDRPPSALMDEMLALLDGHAPCMLFEQLFVNRMPDPIRLQLADADFSDPHKVDERADELWQYMSLKDSSIHRVGTGGNLNPPRRTVTLTGVSIRTSSVTRQKNACVPPCKFQENSQAGGMVFSKIDLVIRSLSIQRMCQKQLLSLYLACGSFCVFLLASKMQHRPFNGLWTPSFET